MTNTCKSFRRLTNCDNTVMLPSKGSLQAKGQTRAELCAPHICFSQNILSHLFHTVGPVEGLGWKKGSPVKKQSFSVCDGALLMGPRVVGLLLASEGGTRPGPPGAVWWPRLLTDTYRSHFLGTYYVPGVTLSSVLILLVIPVFNQFLNSIFVY